MSAVKAWAAGGEQGRKKWIRARAQTPSPINLIFAAFRFDVARK